MSGRAFSSSTAPATSTGRNWPLRSKSACTMAPILWGALSSPRNWQQSAPGSGPHRSLQHETAPRPAGWAQHSNPLEETLHHGGIIPKVVITASSSMRGCEKPSVGWVMVVRARSRTVRAFCDSCVRASFAVPEVKHFGGNKTRSCEPRPHGAIAIQSLRPSCPQPTKDRQTR